MQTKSLDALHPNIRPLRLHALLREANFAIPVIIAYAALKDVSFAQFVALQVYFRLVLLLADPICGLAADRFGRRKLFIVGSAMWALGHAALLFGSGWPVFALMETLLAIGVAAFQPSADALLYDSLKANNAQAQHYRTYTRQRSFMSYGAALTYLAGGFMFQASPTLPVAATALLGLVIIACAMRVSEVPHIGVNEARLTYTQMVRQVATTLAHAQTRWLVLLPGLVSAGTVVLFWALQPVLLQANVAPWLAGIIVAGYLVARGWFSHICPALDAKLTPRQCFLLAVVCFAFGTVSLALLPWWAALPGFALGCGLSYMLADSMGRELVHAVTSSRVRATTMGAYQLAGRICGMASLGLTALLQPQIGLTATLLAVGGLVTGLSVLCLTRLPNTKRA